MYRICLFAYGTLLDERMQRRVFGRVLVAMSARLPGWRVAPRLVRGRYPGIVREAGATAAGAVLKINSAELARADAYEGALYARCRVSACARSRIVRAWVYVPVATAATE